MVRHNNQLPFNLPQLQNLIKRDPPSYKEEFDQQYQHFLSLLEIFNLDPNNENTSLDALVMFIAQVSSCYPDKCKEFPQLLADLLKKHAASLDPGMRKNFVKALILMRNKSFIPAQGLIELFFQILSCPDKELRNFLQTHIINDIKNMNAKHKNMKLNSSLQSFMFRMLNDSNARISKMSVDIMTSLFKKNVWNDAKTVNAIATVGCFSKATKVLVASLKFFLGHDDEDNDDENSESEEEVDLKAAIMQSRVNKKTKKRKKQLDQIKKKAVKITNKKKNAEPFNFSGIHLIYNPQGIAEGLFKQLQSGNERFEVKIMHLDVISRLIGIHNLFLFSFYSYISRFLQPQQRLVTRILQFSAQASHDLIPGDVIEPILKKIANNFITERNSSDVMAIGLNAIREICIRCPLAMSEDLLRDLAMYKTYKDKSVMMAARSLITLFRERLPALLHKKDRGRQTEAQAEYKVKEYGAVEVHETIPGAEVLLKNIKTLNSEGDSDSDSDCDDEWIDVQKSDNESLNSNQDNEDEESDDEDDDRDDDDDDGDDDKNIQKTTSKVKNSQNEDPPANGSNSHVLNEKEAIKELAATRIFTDEDFKLINAANIKKAVTAARKRPLEEEKSEFVKLDSIEMIFKKRKHDKDSRLQTVTAGREDRQKFGYKDGRKDEHCSKTNREKIKNKNFLMMQHKARTKGKKSFRDKQLRLRNHLLKQKKMK